MSNLIISTDISHNKHWGDYIIYQVAENKNGKITFVESNVIRFDEKLTASELQEKYEELIKDLTERYDGAELWEATTIS